MVRDRFEELEGVEKRRGDVPRLDAFAQRYLREDTDHLAATALRQRKRILGTESPLILGLGPKRLDAPQASADALRTNASANGGAGAHPGVAPL